MRTQLPPNAPLPTYTYVPFVTTPQPPANTPRSPQIHKPVGVKYPSHWCLKQWPSQTASRLYEGGMFTFVFALPLTVITVAYIDISRTLWKVRGRASMAFSMRGLRGFAGSRFSGSKGDFTPRRIHLAIHARDTRNLYVDPTGGLGVG